MNSERGERGASAETGRRERRLSADGADADAATAEAGESADSAGEGSNAAYVHRPEGAAPAADPADRDLGTRGWILVGVVVLCVLVVPGVIYLRPSLPPRAGLGFFATMLVLPLVPAVLLGAAAVWSAMRDRRRPRR